MLSKTKFVMIYDHITTHSSEISRLIESNLEDRRTELSCRVYPDFLPGRYFNTDYQMETKEIDDNGLAMFITEWLDLGSGPGPVDSRCRVRFGREKATEIGKLGQAGDIRLRFECRLGPSQDPLPFRTHHFWLKTDM